MCECDYVTISEWSEPARYRARITEETKKCNIPGIGMLCRDDRRSGKDSSQESGLACTYCPHGDGVGVSAKQRAVPCTGDPGGLGAGVILTKWLIWAP